MHAALFTLAVLQGLVSNGGFENLDQGAPVGWVQRTWGGTGTFDVAVGRAGRGVAISSTKGGDLSWSAKVAVKGRTWYRLSASIRTEGLSVGSGVGALLNVHELGTARTPGVSGTHDWTRVESVFRTGDQTEITVNCLFGGWGLSTGKAWFDDVTLEPIDMKLDDFKFTIHTEATGHPISKYVFGQFIEHLGRCIQGGIWAEMLEDRKFHFPVTKQYGPWQGGKEPGPEFAPVLVASPWKVVSGSVKMVPGTGWTPQAVPEISNGAIEQGWLALEKGKAYVGRIVLTGDATISLNKQVQAFVNVDEGVYHTFNFRFTAGETTAHGALRIATHNKARIAAVSLMPADNVQGFRKDVIAQLKKLNAPIYRWPGGNFASGYDWRDGLGNPDKRPSSPNPAWTGVETNDVGIHEFMTFCKLVGTEPLVVANTGFGDPVSAALWVEYCNGPATSPMGALRAKNGSKKPFGVKWWGIGNEMYGDWQLGHIPVSQYVLKHIQTVDRMRRVDPTIQTVGVGARGSWDDTMIPRTKDHMTLLSQHHYWQERSDPMDHILQARSTVSDLARYSRAKLEGTKLKIAFDEYNYWYGPHVFGELGTRYFQKDGLGIAAALHEMFRNSDVFEMALYAQTVNVIGAIKATRTTSFFESTGLVLALYRQAFGTLPVKVDGPSAMCDVAAAWTADRKTLTIAAINPTDAPAKVTLAIDGALPNGDVERFVIANDDPNAFNSAAKPNTIAIVRKAEPSFTPTQTLPPFSATIWRIQR